MEAVQYSDWQTFIAVLLVILGAFFIVDRIVDIIQKRANPVNQKHREDMEFVESIERRFASDQQSIADLTDMSKMTLRCVMNLLNHEIDGNHIERLKETRDAAEKFLIEH